MLSLLHLLFVILSVVARRIDEEKSVVYYRSIVVIGYRAWLVCYKASQPLS